MSLCNQVAREQLYPLGIFFNGRVTGKFLFYFRYTKKTELEIVFFTFVPYIYKTVINQPLLLNTCLLYNKANLRARKSSWSDLKSIWNYPGWNMYLEMFLLRLVRSMMIRDYLRDDNNCSSFFFNLVWNYYLRWQTAVWASVSSFVHWPLSYNLNKQMPRSSLAVPVANLKFNACDYQFSKHVIFLVKYPSRSITGVEGEFIKPSRNRKKYSLSEIIHIHDIVLKSC